jgi:hypothetical protein
MMTMNTATPRKIQTAFRLDANLVSRLKLKAKREKKSLNHLVEEHLEKIAPDEDGLVWPRIKFPIEPNPKWKDLTMDIHITKEDLEKDDRLAYILSKGQER